MKNRAWAPGSRTGRTELVGGTRVLVLAALVLAVLFALLAITASQALAAQTEGKSARLTPEQREKFVEGAKEIAGLSNLEIKRVLRDPENLDAIPVGVEDTLERGPAQPSGETRGTRAATVYCTFLKGTRWYVNASKERLFSVTGTKRWCYNYSIVTSAPLAALDYTVTAKGRSEGWQYIKLVQRAEGYKAYAGNPRGSHTSTLTARFRNCKTGTTCRNLYPQYTGIGRYDGTGAQTIRTLSAPPAQ